MSPLLLVCQPRYTQELQQSINEGLKNLWGFYCFNRKKLEYDTGRDNLKVIVEDFLQPWVENKTFDESHQQYELVMQRYREYFSQIHTETIKYIDDTPEGRRHEEVFDIMRGELENKLALIGESILQWYKRTHKWNEHTQE